MISNEFFADQASYIPWTSSIIALKKKNKLQSRKTRTSTCCQLVDYTKAKQMNQGVISLKLASPNMIPILSRKL